MNTLNFFLSIIAIIIGFIAFFVKGCCTISEAVLAIIAICTTLIVGFAIVDNLRIHQMEKKIKDLEDIAISLTETKKELSAAFDVSLGVSFINWQPYTAFNYFQKGLEKSICMNNVKWIGQSLKCMENVPKMIQKMNKNGTKIEDKMKSKISLSTPDSIKEYEAYKAFQERIDRIYKEIQTLN